MRSRDQWPTYNDDDAEVRRTGEADGRGELGGMADREANSWATGVGMGNRQWDNACSREGKLFFFFLFFSF